MFFFFLQILPLVGTASKGKTKDAFTTICFARAYDLKLGTIGDRLRAIQPSLFLGVPRVWEKMNDKIMALSRGMYKCSISAEFTINFYYLMLC